MLGIAAGDLNSCVSNPLLRRRKVPDGTIAYATKKLQTGDTRTDIYLAKYSASGGIDLTPQYPPEVTAFLHDVSLFLVRQKKFRSRSTSASIQICTIYAKLMLSPLLAYPNVSRRHVLTERNLVMVKSAINPEGIPVLGIYTPAFKVSDGELIILSGVVGVDADGKTVGLGDAAAQTRQALSNIKAILKAAGASLDDVIHVRIFSTDMRNRSAINSERRKIFKDPMPASTHVQVVQLVNEEWLLEIEVTAFVSKR